MKYHTGYLAGGKGRAGEVMVKVSITLPNAALITLESEEPEVVREVVQLALRELPQGLMHAGLNGSTDSNVPGVPESVEAEPGRPDPGRPNPSRNVPAGAEAETGESPPPAGVPRNPDTDLAFAEFCRAANPMGDMRRVVVAAEGAGRHLGMPSVDASELATLFGMAGWPVPHSFTQTLRNAARGKFQWMERVPGRAGRYLVTGVGRSVTLGQ